MSLYGTLPRRSHSHHNNNHHALHQRSPHHHLLLFSSTPLHGNQQQTTTGNEPQYSTLSTFVDNCVTPITVTNTPSTPKATMVDNAHHHHRSNQSLQLIVPFEKSNPDVGTINEAVVDNGSSGHGSGSGSGSSGDLSTISLSTTTLLSFGPPQPSLTSVGGSLHYYSPLSIMLDSSPHPHHSHHHKRQTPMPSSNTTTFTSPLSPMVQPPTIVSLKQLAINKSINANGVGIHTVGCGSTLSPTEDSDTVTFAGSSSYEDYVTASNSSPSSTITIGNGSSHHSGNHRLNNSATTPQQKLYYAANSLNDLPSDRQRRRGQPLNRTRSRRLCPPAKPNFYGFDEDDDENDDEFDKENTNQDNLDYLDDYDDILFEECDEDIDDEDDDGFDGQQTSVSTDHRKKRTKNFANCRKQSLSLDSTLFDPFLLGSSFSTSVMNKNVDRTGDGEDDDDDENDDETKERLNGDRRSINSRAKFGYRRLSMRIKKALSIKNDNNSNSNSQSKITQRSFNSLISTPYTITENIDDNGGIRSRRFKRLRSIRSIKQLFQTSSVSLSSAPTMTTTPPMSSSSSTSNYTSSWRRKLAFVLHKAFSYSSLATVASVSTASGSSVISGTNHSTTVGSNNNYCDTTTTNIGGWWSRSQMSPTNKGSDAGGGGNDIEHKSQFVRCNSLAGIKKRPLSMTYDLDRVVKQQQQQQYALHNSNVVKVNRINEDTTTKESPNDKMHMVQAFQQSLSSMTNRLQQISSSSELKDCELDRLRKTIESLKQQATQAAATVASSSSSSSTCKSSTTTNHRSASISALRKGSATLEPGLMAGTGDKNEGTTKQSMNYNNNVRYSHNTLPNIRSPRAVLTSNKAEMQMSKQQTLVKQLQSKADSNSNSGDSERMMIIGDDSTRGSTGGTSTSSSSRGNSISGSNSLNVLLIRRHTFNNALVGGSGNNTLMTASMRQRSSSPPPPPQQTTAAFDQRKCESRIHQQPQPQHQKRQSSTRTHHLSSSSIFIYDDDKSTIPHRHLSTESLTSTNSVGNDGSSLDGSTKKSKTLKNSKLYKGFTSHAANTNWIRSSFSRAFKKNKSSTLKSTTDNSCGFASDVESSSHYVGSGSASSGGLGNARRSSAGPDLACSVPSSPLLSVRSFKTSTSSSSDTSKQQTTATGSSSDTGIIDPPKDVVDLRKQLREKDMQLTDMRLESLTSAHQMENLKEMLNQMRMEMMSLKQDNDRLQRLVNHKSLASSASSLGTSVHMANVSAPSQPPPPPVMVVELEDELNLDQLSTTIQLATSSNNSTKGDHKPVTLGTGTHTLASFALATKTNWPQLDAIVKRLFKEHLIRVDSNLALGITVDSLACYRVGAEQIQRNFPTASTSDEHNNNNSVVTLNQASQLPELLPFGYLVEESHINVQFKSTMDSFAFDTLTPKSVLAQFLTLLADTRRLILAGPSGTGKTYLAHKLAEYLVITRQLQENTAGVSTLSAPSLTTGAIATFSVDHKNAKNLRAYLSNIAEQCEMKSSNNSVASPSSHTHASPSMVVMPLVIILDNLHHIDDSLVVDIFNDLHRLEQHPHSPYIIGTINQNVTTATTVKSKKLFVDQFHFRLIHFTVNTEPVKGFLSRYLRRKWLECEAKHGRMASAQLDAQPIARIIDWIPKVLLYLNRYLESFFPEQNVCIGPRLFTSCPIDQNGSQLWFTDLWNFSILPFITENLRDLLSKATTATATSNAATTVSCDRSRMYSWLKEKFVDPTEWIIDNYPWVTTGGGGGSGSSSSSGNGGDNNGAAILANGYEWTDHLNRLRLEDILEQDHDLLAMTNNGGNVTIDTSTVTSSVTSNGGPPPPLRTSSAASDKFGNTTNTNNTSTKPPLIGSGSSSEQQQSPCKTVDPFLEMLLKLKEASK